MCLGLFHPACAFLDHLRVGFAAGFHGRKTQYLDWGFRLFYAAYPRGGGLDFRVLVPAYLKEKNDEFIAGSGDNPFTDGHERS